ncbi:hypothetical protein [Actinomycetospora sp. CA-053990]|uniref:hypothetical protein n=1 Tax=Actinomycetospora sp. CA-053990 TaxID=3239891 RepID=UPI003D9360B1
MGTAGGAIIISIVAAVISLGSLISSILIAIRNERSKKADVLRDSRQRLLYHIERLRLWGPEDGDETAYDALATLRAIVNEEPTCVSDREAALASVHRMERRVSKLVVSRGKYRTARFRLEPEESDLSELPPGFAVDVALITELENECTVLLKLASPPEPTVKQ